MQCFRLIMEGRHAVMQRWGRNMTQQSWCVGHAVMFPEPRCVLSMAQTFWSTSAATVALLLCSSVLGPLISAMRAMMTSSVLPTFHDLNCLHVQQVCVLWLGTCTACSWDWNVITYRMAGQPGNTESIWRAVCLPCLYFGSEEENVNCIIW